LIVVTAVLGARSAGSVVLTVTHVLPASDFAAWAQKSEMCF
jgi:hypothetical protein